MNANCARRRAQLAGWFVNFTFEIRLEQQIRYRYMSLCIVIQYDEHEHWVYIYNDMIDNNKRKKKMARNTETGVSGNE